MKALFPGSFDPPTLGHLDLIERGSRLFDQLTIGVAEEGEKPLLFTAEEREALVRKACSHLSNVEVVRYGGLTVSLAKERGIPVILRGVRSAVDLEYERGLALANRRQTGCETLVLIGSGEHAHISASIIREIGKRGGDLSLFIPPAIAQEVAHRFL